MHVVVSKKDFLRVLTRCQGVADKKSTMPVLGNVLLDVAGPQTLRISATDLTLAVTATVPAAVETQGSIALGARDLLERVRTMPEGQIAIIASSSSSTSIRAVGSARRFTVQGVPGHEFPTLPHPETNARGLTLPVSVLAQLLASTHFSISTDETRLHLSSALFECDGERVRMVTTDGHRLSKMEVIVAGKQSPTSMLIPLKGVLELRRLCDEVTSEKAGEHVDELKVVQSGANVFFELPGFEFSVKLVDAQFPPYHQVIPERSERKVSAPRYALIDALKAVSIAASDRTGGIRLTLNSGAMRFSSESPDAGEGFDEIPVNYQEGEVMIGLNARYFLDVLGAIHTDEVELNISGELDPVIIRPVQHGDGPHPVNYLAVIMPMRI